MPSTTNSNNPLSYELSDNDIEFLLKQAQAGVVAAEDLADVSDASGVRTLDGFGNNVENPLWGNADQTFKRLSDTHFDNGVDTPREGPVPRDISNLILNQNKDGETNNFGPNAGDDDLNLENNFRANEFVWAFGQYFDHGLDFIPKGGENGDGTEAGTMFLGNFETQNGDIPLTLTRATPADGTGINGVPREYINQTSPFIDQNQAYGSNDKILEFLLERDDNGQFTGRLLSGANTDIPTLGEAKANWQKGVDNGLAEAIDFDDPDALSNFRGSGDALLLDINPGIPLDLHLVAGDGRVNENAGLSVVHTSLYTIRANSKEPNLVLVSPFTVVNLDDDFLLDSGSRRHSRDRHRSRRRSRDRSRDRDRDSGSDHYSDEDDYYVSRRARSRDRDRDRARSGSRSSRRSRHRSGGGSRRGSRRGSRDYSRSPPLISPYGSPRRHSPISPPLESYPPDHRGSGGADAYGFGREGKDHYNKSPSKHNGIYSSNR